MSIDNITKQHVLDAVDKIEREGIVLAPSTRFDVVINGKAYPPKEVMRYANLIANGTKDWLYSGGEPTNKYLRKFEFEIVPKGEEPEMPATKEGFIQLLQRMGQANATQFFGGAADLMDKLKAQLDDARLTYGTRANKRLTITIGQRYCYAYIPAEENAWQFIHDTKIPTSDAIEVSKYDGEPLAYYYRCSGVDAISAKFDGLVRAAEKELSRTSVSGFRRHNNAIFEKAVLDATYRKQLFDEAFTPLVELSGRVFKLGCRWGNGAPSFYDFIRENEIVICTSDLQYKPGDLIIIAEGHSVLALAKVLEIVTPATNNQDLKDPFDELQINYDSWVEYSSAAWYILSEDERFNYPVTTGRHGSNDPYRSKAINLWKDRFINYWVFQCNPAEFDYAKAVKSNLLHDWTVASHKDKIKTNDKVILWLTGKRAGCYALARITSDPAEAGKSPDNHLWKSEPKISLKAGIELTHNLVDNPLLWQNIKSTKGLEELKVGNQGTNFSATRKQYHTLLKLIEANTQNMGKKLDLHINTILYGPPGTGKTHTLNNYKKQFFIDSNKQASREELLIKKLKEHSLWEIVAAILIVKDNYASVPDICESELVKIKKDPKKPTKSYYLVRNSLISYSDDDSSEYKKKRKERFFTKNESAEWSVIPALKEELRTIIGEDLIKLAKGENIDVAPIEVTELSSRYNFITFHQKYSYEDFIEGIKPLLSSEDAEEQSGELQFELKKGIFYNSCLEALRLVGYDSFEACYQDSAENRIAKFETAKSNPSMQFALFIDEINRANISAVFGELITLLEDDKRIGADNEMWLELPYSNEKFSVPGNLFVIGTMNTADRSIALLDIALRRRFEFRSLYPEYIETEWWASLLEALNQAIYNWKKNPDFFIGHAFFINKPEADRARILNTKIIPLLYEYCQSNAATVKNILSEAGVGLKSTGIKENFQLIAE